MLTPHRHLLPFCCKERKKDENARMEMRDENQLNDFVPCSSLSVDATIRAVTAGATWGLCVGPESARKMGLIGISRSVSVAKAMGKFSFQCGLVAGVFTSTHCGLQRYRHHSDWVNALIAGGVAGAGVAVGTRNWKQVAGTACFLSALGAAADYFKAF